MSKKNKSMFDTRCMIVLLLMLIVILIGCKIPGCKLQVKDSPREEVSREELPDLIEPSIDLTSLRELAEQFGVEDPQSKKFEELISDIKVKLVGGNNYYGNRLSEQDLKDLDDYLADVPGLLERIKQYNKYILKLDGHKVVLLPK